MSYAINLTNGTLVVTVPPGVRDTTTFSITIIGQNVSNYGEDIAENFVHMLENFANTTPPSNPLVGQIWYDSAAGVLKVFDGTSFIAIQTRVGTSLPASPSPGDMFFNDNQRQLYVADSGGTFRFAGIPGGFVDNFSAVTNVEATRYGTYVQNLYLLEQGTLQPRAVLAQIYEWNGSPIDHPSLEPTDAQNGQTVIAIWSDHPTFIVDPTSPLSTNIAAGFPGSEIRKGLNIRINSLATLRSPLEITSGGTGGITAAVARTNLGAVSIAGDTMTGDLTIGVGTGARSLTLNGASGFSRKVNFRTGGSDRWLIQASPAVETGSNVGSDFHINRFGDTGSFLDTPLSIARSTGTVDINTMNFGGLIRPRDDNTYDIGTPTFRVKTVHAVTFEGTATSALYADLAERFHSDKHYEPGTIVMIGGDNEITCIKEADSDEVFGVISTDPALRMNAGAGNDETHPYIALSGRVPTFITGKVRKGDRIVSSSIHGVGKAADAKRPDVYTVIGRSLEDKDAGYGVATVMVAVGAK